MTTNEKSFAVVLLGTVLLVVGVRYGQTGRSVNELGWAILAVLAIGAIRVF